MQHMKMLESHSVYWLSCFFLDIDAVNHRQGCSVTLQQSPVALQLHRLLFPARAQFL